MTETNKQNKTNYEGLFDEPSQLSQPSQPKAREEVKNDDFNSFSPSKVGQSRCNDSEVSANIKFNAIFLQDNDSDENEDDSGI